MFVFIHLFIRRSFLDVAVYRLFHIGRVGAPLRHLYDGIGIFICVYMYRYVCIYVDI